jgi:hypothetical protein
MSHRGGPSTRGQTSQSPFGLPHPERIAGMSVPVIVAISVLAPLILILGPITVLVVRRRRTVRAELAALLATEPALRGPEGALYRGGTGPYPKVKGNGALVLTRRRLWFRILIGTSLDIPIEEITGTREAKRFHGAATGRLLVIVQTAQGEAGFLVDDNAAWIAAIEQARA